MKTNNLKLWCLTVGTLLASTVVAVPAIATGSSGFSRELLVNGNFGSLDVKTESEKTGKWGMILKTKDDTDVGSDRLTLQRSGYSGWHSHPAPVFVTVTSGEIIWYDGSNPLCTPHHYTVGQSFIEGAYRIHNVKNASSSSIAQFVAIRINPTDVPFRIDATKPNNCQ